jgi:tripartite-type tricarboxylate transporter receptor subunit TctC
VSVEESAMKLARRTFLHLAAGAAALPAVSRLARAQTYPARPVRLVVGFPPAGGADIMARLIAPSLEAALGQRFVIENRPGAASNIATEAVVGAAPDGYTLLLTLTPNVVNAALYHTLNFDFIRDIAPVAGISREVLVMVVHPSVPARSVAEFIAYAKASPGKINFVSGGNGTTQHVAGELFKMLTGIDMVHVPYRGAAPALTDLLSGRVQIMFPGLASSVAYVKAGKLRALAVTSATRTAALPDLPTVADAVPGYEASTWYGVGAPRRTPADIVARLNREINAAVADAKIQARLADLGCAPLAGSPADFGRIMADDAEKWAEVIKFADVKPP